MREAAHNPGASGDYGEVRHTAQLFDTPETRADAATAFIVDGDARGEHVVVAFTAGQWALIVERLTRADYPLAARLADGRLRLFDAMSSLRGIMRHGRPDPTLFATVFGDPLRQLLASGARLRACGELVDLLAAQGDFRGVVAIEHLWDALARQQHFTLYCLYSSVHFGHPRSQDALRQICRAHTHVEASPADELGEWLLREQVRAFGPM